MAIMQSKLFLFLYRVSNQGESRVIPQVKASKLESLPFPVCDKPYALLTNLSNHCRQMYDCYRAHAVAKTPHEKSLMQRRIETIDRQIDALVYELYGLTEEEKNAVDPKGIAK